MITNDVVSNVIANLIAWPIIIALGFGIRRSWRFVRKIDALAAQEVSTNIPFRTAASANAVSDIVIGCSAVLAGLMWLFYISIFQISGLLLQMNALTINTVGKLGGVKNVVAAPMYKSISSLGDAISPYPAYLFFLCGILLVFMGRRVLSHLSRATEKHHVED